MNLILKGREERVKKRINFMKVNKANSYLCLTINMPGYNKTNNFSKKVFGDAQKVIKKELNQKNVNYVEVNDVDIMQEKGFLQMPMLEVDNIMMDFVKANQWLNNQ